MGSFRIFESFYTPLRDGPDVPDDSYLVSAGPHGIIRTSGIGCCLGITLYDTESRIGALAHIRQGSGFIAGTPISPRNIVPTLLEHMREKGAYLRELEASLCGENLTGLMTDYFKDRNASSIVREDLDRRGIRIIGEDLGAKALGRGLILRCDDGSVEVHRLQF